MKQDQRSASVVQGGLELEDLAKTFAGAKNKKVTRSVTLVYQSCCGCGCSDVNVKRTVTADSNLKDGDRIKKMIDGDEIV